MAVDGERDERVDHDVVVVGSGFGGSVAALRLAEKGYDVLVLEAGRRFEDTDFARTSFDLRRFLWAPALGLYGVQRIHRLRDVLILAGAGVGGGSLNYANTLYVPPASFFADPQWAHITDWADELAPHYDQASRMLGVVENPVRGTAERLMRDVAEDLGAGRTFRLTPTGVFYGRDGRQEPGVTVPDPYFGGAGPARTGCTQCGNCMVGCRHGAKNTLVKNYLALAERLGVRVAPMRTVEEVRPLPVDDGSLPGSAGWTVTSRRTDGSGIGRLLGRRAGRTTVRARHVVLAAGAWGTAELLQSHRARGVLPGLSDRLGELTRTNSEALLGVTARRRVPGADLSTGVAITTSFHVDEHTHVENCRYGRGSDLMGWLGTVLVDGDPAARPGARSRWRRVPGAVVRQPVQALFSLAKRGFAERSIILLVMQDLDNALTVSARRRLLGRGFRLVSRQGRGEPAPRWIPQGHAVARRLAARMEGDLGVRADPGGSLGDLADVPMTAHFIGGCPIGDSPAAGVVDPYHRVYGYPGLHVTDGSTLSANLGVNPSLSITAQAERAMALWPNRGEDDERPPLGAPYRRTSPVPPAHPAVPASAPGALRR